MDDNRKRRLPPWMLGVAASKPDDGELIHTSSHDFRPSNSNSGITHPQQEEKDEEGTLEVKSNLIAECGTERRKRKLKIQYADHGGDGHGTDSVEESAPKKGRKTRKVSNSRVESREKAGVQSPIEDEGELTVEDLISIAQEVIFLFLFSLLENCCLSQFFVPMLKTMSFHLFKLLFGCCKMYREDK